MLVAPAQNSNSDANANILLPENVEGMAAEQLAHLNAIEAEK